MRGIGRRMGKFASSLAVWLLAFGIAVGARGQAAPGQCGYDRWPVKTLTDKDAGRVDFHPLDTTVAKLAAIPIHEIPYPDDHRIAPEEFNAYRVRARLVAVRREQDEDLHLIIADIEHPQTRMIAEIPAPACTTGTGREEEYRRARAVARAAPLGSEIELVGVGFFDFIHDQSGRAKNEIELHPVLRVRVLESKGGNRTEH
jgi:hypothetical protein